MNDVKISKRNGGLSRRNPSDDMVAAFIMHGVAVAQKIALAEVKQLYSVNDAVALGLDAAYDTANGILVYYHIAEYFRLNPDGELFIMLVAQTTVFANMVDPAIASIKTLLNTAEGRVRILGAIFNPDEDYEATLTTGLDGAVLAAITKAQLLADAMDEQNTPLDAIIIDGREFNGSTAAAVNLRLLVSDRVSVCIHRDQNVTINPKGSAVGTIVGVISLAKVNENIGWVQRFNVANINQGKYLQAGLTNGSAINTFAPSDYDTLNDKGFIFLRKIPGIAGVYFNDSHTCTALADDYAYIENNRTINKAIRAVRTALLPKVSGPLFVDEETGMLEPETAKSFEADAQNVIDQMQRDNEISGGDSFCDETQNVLSTSEVAVEIEVVPTGTGRKISASIGFNNPFKQS